MLSARLSNGPPIGALLVGLLLIIVTIFPLIVNGEYPVFIATQVGVYLLVAMSLNLLTGYAGLPSLGHGALMAVGAYCTALLMVDAGWSFWPAVLVSMIITSFTGGLMVIPAFRVSTWYFALITLGFAEVVGSMLIEWSKLTHAFNGVVGIPMPRIYDHVFSGAELYWLVAVLNVICFVSIARLVDSRFGRGLIAIRDNPEAAIATGISLGRLKLAAFLISAAITGLAGALFAVQKTVITPDDFKAEFSIFFLVVVVLGGSGRLWGPALGCVVFFIVPELLVYLQSWRLVVYGVLLLLLMLFAPQGLEGALVALWRRFVPRPKLVAPVSTADGGAAITAINGMAVEIKNVQKSFGGVRALDGVSLNIKAGSVHAIVGSNGSGKTTLLNLMGGYYRVDGGTIKLDQHTVAGKSPSQIASVGVGRTFQTPKLLPDLNTLNNVMLGGFATERAWLLEIIGGLPRANRERASLANVAMNYLNFVGLDGQSAMPAGELPHGQQRLAEIARALTSNPRLLLLDEPAAGLSLTELDKLAALIRAIGRRGITIIIVEHHLELVSSVCERITVFDRGMILAEGNAAEVFSNKAVMRAYMGTRSLDQDAAAQV